MLVGNAVLSCSKRYIAFPLSDEMFDLIHDMGDGEMMVMVELDILMTLKELAKYG